MRIQNLNKSAIWTVIFIFAHALSDVFLSLNLLSLSMVLLWFSHRLSLAEQIWKKACAGLFFALATGLRFTPLLLLPFFLTSSKRRSVLAWAFLFGCLGLLATFLVFPSGKDWWVGWFKALSLYPQAADVFTSTFQTPLSVVNRFAHFVLGFDRRNLSVLEIFLGMSYWFSSFWVACRFENQKKFDWAFAVLLSSLYVSFSRVWASGFFYVLPLVVLCLRKKFSKSVSVGALLYALTPQWLWPKPLWDYATGVLGIQGIILSTIIGLCWKEAKFQSR